MRQPTSDGTLTWPHFKVLLSQNCYNKKLCSQEWQIHGTCATRGPLHIRSKPSTLLDRLGLRGHVKEFQGATTHQLEQAQESVCLLILL